jgi:hypothetical protein
VRHDLLREQRDVGDRVLMVQEAALTKEQEMAEAPDAVIQILDLVVDIVGRAGKAGGTFHQLIERRGRVVHGVAVAVAHEAAALAPRFEHRDIVHHTISRVAAFGVLPSDGRRRRPHRGGHLLTGDVAMGP